MDSDILFWYPLRVTYSRELKVREIFCGSGCEAFVPMTVRMLEKNGVKEYRTVPAVGNLCFIRACRTAIDEIREAKGLKSYTSYIWNKGTRRPITVPDKAMDDFIRVSETMREDIVYLHELNSKLRQGQMVRVIAGPFSGVEGRVVRVKRSRRVMVELPGMMAVATGYVPEADLEIIS